MRDWIKAIRSALPTRKPQSAHKESHSAMSNQDLLRTMLTDTETDAGSAADDDLALKMRAKLYNRKGSKKNTDFLRTALDDSNPSFSATPFDSTPETNVTFDPGDEQVTALDGTQAGVDPMFTALPVYSLNQLPDDTDPMFSALPVYSLDQLPDETDPMFTALPVYSLDQLPDETAMPGVDTTFTDIPDFSLGQLPLEQSMNVPAPDGVPMAGQTALPAAGNPSFSVAPIDSFGPENAARMPGGGNWSRGNTAQARRTAPRRRQVEAGSHRKKNNGN